MAELYFGYLPQNRKVGKPKSGILRTGRGKQNMVNKYEMALIQIRQKLVIFKLKMD